MSWCWGAGLPPDNTHTVAQACVGSVELPQALAGQFEAVDEQALVGILGHKFVQVSEIPPKTMAATKRKYVIEEINTQV